MGFRTKCVRDDDKIRLNIDSLGEGGVMVWLNDAQYAKVRDAINEFEASEADADYARHEEREVRGI